MQRLGYYPHQHMTKPSRAKLHRDAEPPTPAGSQVTAGYVQRIDNTISKRPISANSWE